MLQRKGYWRIKVNWWGALGKEWSERSKLSKNDPKIQRQASKEPTKYYQWNYFNSIAHWKSQSCWQLRPSCIWARPANRTTHIKRVKVMHIREYLSLWNSATGHDRPSLS
jgi:hypothetical protein